MTRPWAVARVLIAGAFVAMPSACRGGAGAAGHGAQADVSAQSPDTLRGMVTRVGSEPGTRLLLQPDSGPAVVMQVDEGAADGAGLERTVGLRIEIHGRRTGVRDATASPRGAERFSVAQFVVRVVDGVAAHDGVLQAKAGRYFLQLRDGRKLAIALLPSSLRDKVGARVFLAGPLDGPPAAYGVIRDAQ